MNKKSLFFWFVAFVCAALIFTGCPQEPDESTPGTKPTVVSAGAIAGVTVPVKSAAPVSEVTATDEYTGTVTWDGTITDGKFAASTVYTATITLSAKEGYTFAGFEGAFTVAGVDDTEDDDGFTDGLKQAAGTGENEGKWVVTAVFPATLATDPAVVSAGAIAGVTAPATGETPVDTVTAGAGYTGTVTWGGTLTDGKFAASTVYTATIVLTATPPAQYTFAGFAGAFTVAGVDDTKDGDGFTDGLKQAAGTGENEGKWVVTAVFPATPANNQAADAAAALVGEDGALNGKATADGTTVTLTDNVDVTGPFEVPDGVTLVVPADKKVTVSANVTVNVGTGSEVEIAGTYELGNNVSGTNNGTVTVKSTGVIKNGTGVNITGTGTNVVEAGGKVYFGGETTDPYIGGSTDANAIYRLENSATFAYNNAGYTIDGNVTLSVPGAAAGSTKNTWIGDGLSLHIEAGGQLTIAQYSQLNIVSDDSGPTVTGGSGSKIIATGYLTFFKNGENWSQTISSVPNVNFYDNAGAKETKNDVIGKTYIWADDADASSDGDQPGWKAEAAGE